MENTTNKNIYQIKATPKDGSPPYLLYKGQTVTKESADVTADSCNKMWTHIFFEAILAVENNEETA